MPEILEDKAKEETGVCDRVPYCPFYNKIISDEMKWEYCHNGECVDCLHKNGFVRGIFSLQHSFDSSLLKTPMVS